MNSREAADVLRVHFKTLEREARKGRIPATKQDKRWVFRRSLLDARLDD
jgi:excisionase family DNA binding protein